MNRVEQILRWITLGGVFLMPFIVLIVAESLFFPYITGKNFAFRIIVEIMTGAWLALALVSPAYRPRPSWMLAAFTAFIIILGIADIFGVNPAKSIWSNFERMEGWVTLAHLFALFVVSTSVLTTERLWKHFWLVSVVVSVIVGVYGLLQAMGIGVFSGGGRIDATLGNTTYMAAYMLVHLFVAALLFSSAWVKKTGRRERMVMSAFFIAAVLIQGTALLLTGTRGTILAAVGGVLLTALLLLLLGRNSRMVWRASAVVIGTIVLLTSGFFFVKDQPWVNDTPILKRLATISLEDKTVRARFMNWGMAWEGVKERPLLGWGQAGYNYVFNKNYNPDMFDQEAWFDRVHNSVFDWAIAGGILGLLSYFALYVVALLYIWRSGAFTIPERSILTGLGAAYVFHNLFVFDNITSYILFIMLLGYITARVASHTRARPLFASIALPHKALPVLALGAIFAVWGVAYALNADALASNRALLYAMSAQEISVDERIARFEEALAYNPPFGMQEIREQLLQTGSRTLADQRISDEDKVRYLTFVHGEMDKQIAADPDNARLHLLTGALLVEARQYDASLPYLLRAQELSPTKQSIFFELGIVAWNRDKEEEALAYFCDAYELAPQFAVPKMYCAAAAVRAGEYEQADTLIEELMADGSVPPQVLIDAYAAQKRFDKIIELWQYRVQARPLDVQANVSLAAAHYLNGDHARAIEILEEMARQVPALEERLNVIIDEIKSGTANIGAQ